MENKVDEFKLERSAVWTIGKDFNHVIQLASFEREYRERFHLLDRSITDEKFRKVKQMISPGKGYKLEMYRIPEGESFASCVPFMETKKGFFGNVQGLTYVWKSDSGFFSYGHTISYDENQIVRMFEKPWVPGIFNAAYVYQYLEFLDFTEPYHYIDMGFPNVDWGYHLLLFCEE